MKIKFDQPIKNLEGKQIKKQVEEGGVVVDSKESILLKDVCVGALMVNEDKLEGIEKMKRYLLAQKIQKANEADLKVEDIALLKELIGKYYGTVVVGYAYNLLEKQK